MASALRTIAALRPGTLCSSHAEPVVDDPDEIERRLLAIAEWLETIVERTITELNDGAPPHQDVVDAVEIPDIGEAWFRSD